MDAIAKLNEVTDLFKEKLERPDIERGGIPLSWVKLFLLAAAANDDGISMMDLAEETGLNISAVSRSVKFMSIDSVLDRGVMKEGNSILFTTTDPIYRHRKRVHLNANGKRLAKQLQKILG